MQTNKIFYCGGSYDVHGQFTARPGDKVVMLLLWCATVHDYITKPSARPEDDLSPLMLFFNIFNVGYNG